MREVFGVDELNGELLGLRDSSVSEERVLGMKDSRTLLLKDDWEGDGWALATSVDLMDLMGLSWVT